jgi:hypothetical protein
VITGDGGTAIASKQGARIGDCTGAVARAHGRFLVGDITDREHVLACRCSHIEASPRRPHDLEPAGCGGRLDASSWASEPN